MNHYTKLRPLALGMSFGLLYAASLAVLSVLAIYFEYGIAMVNFFTTVYLGYELTAVGILIGTGYAFVDGFIGGFLLALLYNLFIKS